MLLAVKRIEKEIAQSEIVERTKGFEPSPPSRVGTALCHKLGPHSLQKRRNLRFR